MLCQPWELPSAKAIPRAQVLFGFCLCEDGGLPWNARCCAHPLGSPEKQSWGWNGRVLLLLRAGIPCPELGQGLAGFSELPWELCPQSQLGSQPLQELTLLCVPRARTQEEFPFPGPRASGIPDVAGRRSLGGARAEGRCHPCRLRRGKRIQQILAPRTFLHPSENPPC